MWTGRVLRTVLPIGPVRLLRRALRPARGIERRILHRVGRGPGKASLLRLPVVPLPAGSEFWAEPHRFTFLEVARDLGDPPDWSVAPSRLWSYHLHDLDALRDGRRSWDARRRLLRSWIAGNPFGSRPGWESYPLSLRLVNSLEAALVAGEADGALVASLAEQAWWLEAGLERDLGANHLFKNGLALAWAGRSIECRAARRWRRKGDAIVGRALREQVLRDGFHYELAPSYHAIFLEDLLRLTALLEASGESESALGRSVRESARRAAGALLSVLHGDGEIPLFGDSALGQAPAPSGLVEAARARIGGREGIPSDPGGARAAGLYRLEADGTVMIFDAGETACSEQPGHGHADTLSFELSSGTERIVVDAGVFDYSNGPERRYARGTAGHNTVEIDGLDQSEVWGAFRLGRRARPLDVRAALAGPRPSLEAAHDGYAHLPGRPIHRRRVEYVGDGTWRVEDRMDGSGTHEAVGRLRLSPDLEVRELGDGSILATGARVECSVRAEDGLPLRLEDGWYFPRFGVKRACRVVRMETAGRLPLRFAYRLTVSRSA